jgi:nitroreductase
MGIIDPAHETTLPGITTAKAGMCIRCGHCEVFCPSHALLSDYLPDEKVPVTSGTESISLNHLGLYLKRRRSIRHFTKDLVPKEKIESLLDIARYAASGGNGQPVQWLVVHNPAEVRKIAGLTIDWMKTLVNGRHPMSGYVPVLIAAWEEGYDGICRRAPHLLIAHIPEGNPIATVDAIIALTHFDIAAPAAGIGTCWAGFVAAACREYPPMQKELALPKGRVSAYAMMFGHPHYKIHGIPRRNSVKVAWK